MADPISQIMNGALCGHAAAAGDLLADVELRNASVLHAVREAGATQAEQARLIEALYYEGLMPYILVIDSYLYWRLKTPEGEDCSITLWLAMQRKAVAL